MHPILNLYRKDFLGFWRNRSAVLLTFVVPLALIWIFGQVFGLNRKNPGPSGIPLVVVNEAGLRDVEPVIAALEKEKAFRVRRAWNDAQGVAHPFTEAQARTDITKSQGGYRFALVFPADALGDPRTGLRLKLLYNPANDIETQTVLGLLEKTVFTSAPNLLFASLRKQAVATIGADNTEAFYDRLADTVSGSFGVDRERVRRSLAENGDPFAAASPATTAPAGSAANTPSTSNDLLSRLVKFEREQLVGQKVRSPEAARVVGGWAVMFLMFSVTSASAALFAERDAGLFLRLLSMPVTRGHILWSKFLFNFTLGLIQLAVCFGAGALLFQIEIFANLPVLIVAAVCASAACTAVGMFLAAIAGSQEAARGLSTFVILTMSAIGGAWWPLSFMPEFMQTLARGTITYWAQRGFVEALWARASFAEILPTLGMLLAIALGLNLASLALFRRSAMFR